MSPGRAAAAAALALVACTTVAPVQRPNRTAPRPAAFSHAALDRVLARHVDARGAVDYAALAAAPWELDAYLGRVAAHSPDRDPDLFPDEASRLAYWINAYNAVAIRLVLEHYPVPSVMDVVSPWLSPLLPEGAGFFFAQRFPLGGDPTSLWALENRIVRRRFADPSYHFALNCASRGCPRLPAEAFDPARLPEQLRRETRRFFAEPRNLRVDPESRTVHLSSLLAWYEDDFLDWQRRRGAEPTLLAYVADHAPGTRAALAGARDFAVRFVPFDWRLNDRGARRGPGGAGLDPGGPRAHHAGRR